MFFSKTLFLSIRHETKFNLEICFKVNLTRISNLVCGRKIVNCLKLRSKAEVLFKQFQDACQMFLFMVTIKSA